MTQRSHLPRWPLCLALLVLVPASCRQSTSIERRALRSESVREAGSVHLAVLAVAPWSHYASALQPNFALSADQARGMVVRDALTEFEMGRRRMGLGASAGQDAEAAPLLPGQQPSSVPPGEEPRLTAVAAPKDRPDAMLEYWNATALYQEVQLLNRSLRDAAIPSGHRAYMVRLQLGLVPRKRHQPYDVYATLSFFSPEDVSAGADARAAALPPTTSLRGEITGAPPTGPSVLPILVTDNLEASSISRSQEDVQRISLLLAGFPGSFAAQAAADLMSSSFAAQVAGRDLNSLLTVSRVSENTLRVRIGAMREPSAGYAMVPRNHYVTLLVMVPDKAPPIVQILARTSLIDTDTGQELAESSDEELEALFEAVRRGNSFPGLDRALLEKLLEHAQRNDQRGFHALLRERMGTAHPGPSSAQALWLDLVSLMVGSRWAASWIELPGHGSWEIPSGTFYDQTAVVTDDGRGASTVTLHGARFATNVDVTAQLRLLVNGREVALPAESVELDGSARRVRITFPSLAALGLAAEARAALAVSLFWSSERADFEGLYLSREP